MALIYYNFFLNTFESSILEIIENSLIISLSSESESEIFSTSVSYSKSDSLFHID